MRSYWSSSSSSRRRGAGRASFSLPFLEFPFPVVGAGQATGGGGMAGLSFAPDTLVPPRLWPNAMTRLDDAATGRVLEICCVWEAEEILVEFFATQSNWTRRGAPLPRDISLSADSIGRNDPLAIKN